MQPDLGDAFNVLRTSVISRPGTIDSSLRQHILSFVTGAEDGSYLSDMVATFVDKVNRESYRITDEDIAALIAADFTEDAIFELVICTAVGAGLKRANCGLMALRDSHK